MDLPIYHLDLLNNRMLIAIIAILHVVINHGMAVGGIPLVSYLEHKGQKTGDPSWDRLAQRILMVFFIVTTTVGALTGVGIWFSTSLVNPYAIGSLIRVFFWGWFTEWIVFVTEVALILAYYLTWKTWVGPRKRAHLRLGVGLSLASWGTMAIIVSILGFMMDPGAWLTDKTFLSGVLNPIYLPQLAFRTPLAMIMAGAFSLPIVHLSTERGSTERARVVRAVSKWMLLWTPACVIGGSWYASVVPEAMQGNLPVALLTQALSQWSTVALWVLAVACVLIAAIAAWGFTRPQSLRPWALILPALLSVALIASFERVREFVRKPYAIANYMYANGIRKDDYPLLQRDGLLTHATYTSVREITDDNEVEAGREVFKIACTRCHTADGVNGMRTLLVDMYGDEQPWDAGAIDAYVGSMHAARPFMPPFPGSPKEQAALAAYLVTLQQHRDVIEGAQSAGVTAAPGRKRLGLDSAQVQDAG
ncbi:cytochrome c [Pseudenhygromyxa sp. WMMC2535]|uniref:cytochrome c n=1 Tax=Pseudenhygromyxa sp. WMMC2535 TaxID=2712867 RepID=UPI001552C480|nr:cytochrome c [Pseudenhygromyxa sp. WMMC2535]NVB42779.1 cytochrome c [Pseudenhygromyxa sp. WMMC2535]